jgi:hypothetical protein
MAAVAATGHLLADAISHGKAEHKGNQRLELGLSNFSFRRRRPSGGGSSVLRGDSFPQLASLGGRPVTRIHIACARAIYRKLGVCLF